MSLNILLSGASGVIGTAVRELTEADPELKVVGTATRERFFDDAAAGDVVVDFSHPELCMRSLEFAVEHRRPMVIGTTGLDEAQQERIDRAAESIAICQAANFSRGVNLLLGLARHAAESLGEDFDIEVLETHHRRKLDAPSGTALALGRELAAARGLDTDDSAVFDRSGRREARSACEIGYQVVRGGDVPGEHTVLFLGDGERLELTHRTGDRSIFARGALLAARRLVGCKPGMADFSALVLGSRAADE